MIPYVLLIFLPLIVPTFVSKYRFKYRLSTKQEQKDSQDILLPLFFTLLIILLALRDETIGRDLPHYKRYFNRFSSLQFIDIFDSDSDVLYVLLNWLIGRFTDNYQVFLSIVAIICVLPIAFIYNEDKRHGFLKIVLYINMSTFVMLFSGLRQSIAIAMGLIAYEFVKKKHLLLFLMFTFIAWGFHHSAFMILFFYPLYHLKLKKSHLWFVIPCVMSFYIFNNQIFTWATNLIGDEKYAATISNTGAYTMLILFVIFAVFSYVIPDEHKMDEEILGLRNFMLVAVMLQCFSPLHTLAMRMNYYYIIFIPILIPKIIICAKDNIKSIAHLSEITLTLFFTFYYLINTYNSCQTGISVLDTYPYVPFWK